MKFTITFVLAICCAIAASQDINVFEKNFQRLHRSPPPPVGSERASADSVTTEWIEQKLDNFDDSETRTWQMRYMANDAYFQAGGPIFIFVGGEWEISEGFLVGGHLHDMAREHNGYLFYTEHRYYGASWPTINLSIANLKWLDIKQALADLAHFIVTIKATTPGLENSKVVLAGGSYSATMVTWFKKLYPELAVGAWSSSAPLLAKVNFVEYKEVTGQSIKQIGGDACYNRIQNGVAELEKMFADKRGAEVKAMLKICNSFDENNDLDLWSLFSSLSDMWAGIVQYHDESYQDIQNGCNVIMRGDDDLIGLANFALWYTGSSSCIDYSYKSWITYLSESTLSTSSMYRQWLYQTCNEYGWYQTSGSNAQPFGSSFPVALYIATCGDVYGAEFTNHTVYKNADDTNEFFGGMNPEVNNVFMTHGSLDPWSAMGITDENQATVIPLYSHCADFGSISTSDTTEMRAAKEQIAELVREWVKDDTLAVTGRKFVRQLYNKL